MKNLNQSASLWLIGVFSLITLVFSGCQPPYSAHRHLWEEWTVIESTNSPAAYVRAIGKCPCGQAGTFAGTLEELSNQIDSYSTISLFKAWLAVQPDNTPGTAYYVKLNLSDLFSDYNNYNKNFDDRRDIGDALRGFYHETYYYYGYSNMNKYVSLDLSGSTFKYIGWSDDSDRYHGTFYDCRNLTGIILPASVTSIGGNAFYYCANITSITIPAGVTSIKGGAFYDCTNLTSVTFQGTILSGNLGGGAYFSYSDGSTVPIPPFDGDLHDKYLAGGPGTYTRSVGSETWTKT